ncbi:MAG: (2Fe-2S) ferredoxin domain-containing protein [Mariprofundus sp.]|nr:(2Fe-2S) ferredoxin domain-containing protein [Mariprofundus sp.]
MSAEQPKIAVCHGPRCGDYGGRALAGTLAARGFQCEVLDCQSLCPYAPIVRIDGAVVHRANMTKLLDRL